MRRFFLGAGSRGTIAAAAGRSAGKTARARSPASKHLFVLLDLVQVRQRTLQLALEVPDAQQAFHARDQLELVDRLADEVVGAALAGLLDVAKLVQGRYHQNLDVARLRVAL